MKAKKEVTNGKKDYDKQCKCIFMCINIYLNGIS